MALTGAADPMTVLAFVAPAWVFVNAALFLGVASRLRLSLPMQALAMLFFTVVPLTQKLHRVGMLDHHYIEFTVCWPRSTSAWAGSKISPIAAPRGRAGGRARRRARLPQRAVQPATAGAGDPRVALGSQAPDRPPRSAGIRPDPAGDDRCVPAALRAVPAWRLLLLPALVVPPVRRVLHGPAVRAGEHGSLHAEGGGRAGRPARRPGAAGPAPARARRRFRVRAAAVPGPHRGARQHPAGVRAGGFLDGDAVLFARAVAAAGWALAACSGGCAAIRATRASFSWCRRCSARF